MLCSICRQADLQDHAGRREAYCPHCKSLERHRALARLFDDVLRDGAGRACLEVGPVSTVVYGEYLRERGWRHRAVDQSRRGNPHDQRNVEFIDAEMDLTDLHGVPSGSIDLVIAQHVVEEIEDYDAALRESARILSPDGVALLEIPFEPRLERSVHQPPAAFGNVWRFGADLPGRLAERFGHVEPVAFTEGDYSATIFRCSARPAGDAPPEDVPAAGEPIRSFWQSPVVLGEINRRITGARSLDPVAFFRDRCCDPPRERALSLRSGGGPVERRFVELGACRVLLGVDDAPELRDRLTSEVADPDGRRPEDRFDLVIAHNVLQDVADVPRWCARVSDLLTPSGVLYVDGFVGAQGSQWTGRQLAIIDRLLAQLPDELRRDVVDGGLREVAGPRDAERVVGEDPGDPLSIPEVLEQHLEPVMVRHTGGAVYHQLFNRIMGNFGEQDALVRVIMELDFLLTDLEAVRTDYLWGVYRRREAPVG